MTPKNAKEIKFCGICKHRSKGPDQKPCDECINKSFVKFREKNREAWELHMRTKDYHVYFEEIKEVEG